SRRMIDMADPGFDEFWRRLQKLIDLDTQKLSRTRKAFANIFPGRRFKKKEGKRINASFLEVRNAAMESRFDPREGGFGGATKFPPSMSVDFLLRYHYRTGDEHALHMATLTLDKMAHGGMYDQVGGGFHRYSTDDHWLVPHFEKMLYDNAL